MFVCEINRQRSVAYQVSLLLYLIPLPPNYPLPVTRCGGICIGQIAVNCLRDRLEVSCKLRFKALDFSSLCWLGSWAVQRVHSAARFRAHTPCVHLHMQLPDNTFL